MKIQTTWQEKMRFKSVTGDHQIVIDAHSPIGNDAGFTPKELVAAAIAGCTGLDVVSLLKKYKEPLESLEITTDVEQTEKGYPTVFKNVWLVFNFKGNLTKEKVLEAVRLSQTKFCGVTAMIVKTAPIHYKVLLNGIEIGTGEAAFGSSLS